MQQIRKGDFFGSHHQVNHFEHITITETTYTHKYVDWHYHKNIYFTYLLDGYLGETNKKESYTLGPGSLLFHNWQEGHCNEKKSDYSRGFHVEIHKSWFERYDIDYNIGEGSNLLVHPLIKGIFDQLYLESKINDISTDLSTTGLLLQIFEQMKENYAIEWSSKPDWVDQLNDILHDECTKKHTLNSLSRELDIHPVHLSRAFPDYFGTTFGMYIRKLKIDKAATLLKHASKTVTEVAFECGFSDQSHFIRWFKNFYGITPFQYKEKVKVSSR